MATGAIAPGYRGNAIGGSQTPAAHSICGPIRKVWSPMRYLIGCLVALAACAMSELDMEEVDQSIEDPNDPSEKRGPITPLPRNLFVETNYGGRTMTIRWTCGGNAMYHVSRISMSGGTWQNGDLSCAISQVFGVDVIQVQPDTPYCFNVRAWNLDHQATTSTVCERSDRYREAPATPTIRGTVTSTKIDVIGTDRSDIESGYRLYRKRVGASSYDLIYSRGRVSGVGSSFTYSDTTVERDTSYYYKLEAWHPWDTSSATMLVESWATPPDAPSNVRFPVVEPTAVTVAWNDNSSNEDGFRIEYSAPSYGSHTTTVGRNTTSKRIPVGSDTTWTFRVVATNEAGTAASPSVTVTTPEPSSTPVDLVPLEVSLNPAFPDPSEDFTFGWRECNLGGVASASYRTVVRLDGAIVHDARYSAGAGVCTWRNIQHAGVGSGDHDFEVVLDANAEIAEASEGNNTNHYAFNVD